MRCISSMLALLAVEAVATSAPLERVRLSASREAVLDARFEFVPEGATVKTRPRAQSESIFDRGSARLSIVLFDTYSTPSSTPARDRERCEVRVSHAAPHGGAVPDR
jgi:hypothetical protein